MAWRVFIFLFLRMQEQAHFLFELGPMGAKFVHAGCGKVRQAAIDADVEKG